MRTFNFLFGFLIFFFSCTANNLVDKNLAKHALNENRVYLNDRMKHSMVAFESLANENIEKYDGLLEIGQSVSLLTQSFVEMADSLVANKQLPKAKTDSLVSVYKTILRDFELSVKDDPALVNRIREFNDPFPSGYAEDFELNSAVLKNNMLLLANHIVGYLKEGVHYCGYRLHAIELSTQKVDSSNNVTLSVASKLVQQLPHKSILVKEITRNGQPLDAIRVEAVTNKTFGEIRLDSLPPGNYEVRGQVRAVGSSDRYFEEDFSHNFIVQ